MDRRQPEVACGHSAPTLRFHPVKEGNDALLDDARHGELLRRYALLVLEILEQELERIPVGAYGMILLGNFVRTREQGEKSLPWRSMKGIRSNSRTMSFLMR